MNIKNEIKAQVVRAGFTMQNLVDILADEYNWNESCFCSRAHFASVPNWMLVLADKSPRSSRSVSNLSAKLQRESIRYKEVVELADVLGYDIVWQKRRER